MHLIQLQNFIIAICLKFIVITQYQKKVTCLRCLLGKNIIKIFIYPVPTLALFQVFAVFNTFVYGYGAYLTFNEYNSTPPELQ